MVEQATARASHAPLRGIMVALITPWTDDGKSIDSSRLSAQVERLIKAGCHGIVPGGSTGEFTACTVKERKQLVEETVKCAAGRVPVVAGTGALSTSEAVDLGAHAAAVGASALMVVPPFYDPLNYAQLNEMLREVHEAAQLAAGGRDMPIMYYNIPAATGTTLSPAQLAGLAEVGVRYLKDTSGNAPDLTEMLFRAEHVDAITVFNGWDSLTFYGLAAGAKGSVWGASNVIPELSVELWRALAVDGDLKKSRELWIKIWPICKFLESHQYASAVKTGMELRGWNTGGMRKPFALLQGEPRQELSRLLRAAGVETVQ